MSNLRQAAQQALEVLENDAMQRTYAGGVRITNAAIALRQALAEPEQDAFCDTHCTWLDHHPDCVRAEPEKATCKESSQVQKPVAWMYTSHYKGDERFITRFQTDLTTYKAVKVWPLYTLPTPRKPDDDEVEQLRALNAELVEALNSLLNDVGRANSMLGAVKARAALTKVEAGK